MRRSAALRLAVLTAANDAPMLKVATICSAAALLVVTLAAPALATSPEHFTVIRPDEGTDPAGTTCTFPVHFSQVERLDIRVFSDGDGNFVKALFHIDYDATISANGKTLVERDTYTRTFYADGIVRDAGLTVHIQGPGGLVMRDAGRIVYNPNGTVAYAQGPHPQLFGASFCDALTP